MPFHALAAVAHADAKPGRQAVVETGSVDDTPFPCLMGAIKALEQAGFEKVGFISQPPPPGQSTDEQKDKLRRTNN